MASPDAARWRELERVYQHAIDLAPADRAAYLDTATPGDEGLRGEIEGLLGLARAADGFLERPAMVEAAAALAAEQDDLIGRRLDGYEIVGLIGLGGTGEVYRARDIRLGRDVALKVLDADTGDALCDRRRFEEEARAASALNHPNIVTIYGVGEAGGKTYIAMELIGGQTLRDRISAGPMPLIEALDVCAAMASALASAHDHGIVHRDLKPENVMVTADGHVKILDFGIAMRLDRGGARDDRTDTSDTHNAIGTIGYMAPEQAAGRLATAQSDQFALGVVLYELLTSGRPFGRGTRAGTLAAILHDEPPPLALVMGHVPPEVSRLVQRCLSKRPDERFARTRDLEQALRGLAATLRAPKVVGVTRRGLLTVAAGAAVAGLSGVALWRFWPLRTIAVLPFASTANGRDADYLGLGLTESLIARLRQLPIAVKPISLVLQASQDAASPRDIGRRIGADYIVSGHVDATDGRMIISAALVDASQGTTLWTQTFSRASVDIFALWDQVATAVVDDGLHLRLTRDERLQLLSRPTSSVEAYDAFLRARPLQMSQSEADYLGARELLQHAVEADPKFAEAWIALAGTYWTAALDNFARPAEAWPEVDRSLAAAAALNPSLTDLRVGRAVKAFFGDWSWPAATREWQAVSAQPDRDIQPELLLTYAMARWALGDAVGALAVVRRARAIDPLSPVFALSEASYLAELQRYDEAAALYGGVAAANPDSAAPYFGLAAVRRAQRRFDEATAARVKGHAIEGDDSDEPMRAAMASARGQDGDRLLEATAVTRIELPRLERRRARGGYVSPLDLARAYARLGDRNRAFRYLTAAFDDRSPGLVFLNVDSAWDGVRGDSVFHSLVTRVGLPPARTSGRQE